MASNEEGALWSILGYLLSGLLIWGGIGYGLDRWLNPHHHWFMLVGCLLGMGASIYSSGSASAGSNRRQKLVSKSLFCYLLGFWFLPPS